MPDPLNFPIAAKPKREIFDPWNSSSTGHQRAENRLSGSTSWRDSRSAKLSEQFKAGLTGGKRVADTVGAGSESFVKGERTANGGWKRGVVRDRASGQVSLWESFRVEHEKFNPQDELGEREAKRTKREVSQEVNTPLEKKTSEVPFSKPHVRRRPATPPPPPISTPPTPPHVKEGPEPTSPGFDDALLASFSPNSVSTHQSPHQDETPSGSPPSPPPEVNDDDSAATLPPGLEDPDLPPASAKPAPPAPPPPIFANLTIYINGSTYPLISDHKLRHLLATHGANLSITPARRAVTHVILGIPAGASAASFASTPNVSGRGAGGALAASKIQKEIARARSAGGKGVRYVSAEWVLECVQRGKRVPEGGFEVVAIGGAGQVGVNKMFGGKSK